MSVRIIDADDLINTLGISDNDIYCEEAIEEYILDNGTLSFAEQERKRGKWIDNRDVSWMCSECGKWLDVLQGDVKMNFCPNCGSYNGGEKK